MDPIGIEPTTSTLPESLRDSAKPCMSVFIVPNVTGTSSHCKLIDGIDELAIAKAGASSDDEDAEKIIAGCGLNEDSLRERAAKLVDQHWQEIMALSRFLLAKQELPGEVADVFCDCLLYTSPSPRDQRGSRMPSSA